jgi:ketosteroid isomerase-like protein
MIDHEFAARFAADWIAAWNAHDLERILEHYAEDFEMASPVISQLMGEPSGTLKGKAAIRTYWAKALARHPELEFELLHVLAGAASITIVYRGHRGLSAEVFWFDVHGKVERAAAHYEAQ